MRNVSDQPSRSSGTAKRQNFEHQKNMIKENIKSRSIIDQTGTYTFNVSSVISNCLKLFCKNEYANQHTQNRPQRLAASLPLNFQL